jgi:hypothetical protein
MGRSKSLAATAPRKVTRKRKQRARPTPRWLKEVGELDGIGQRRCLLILSVLSGEKPVTEAVAEAQLTRPHYYQLEARALRAMLRAVTPGSDSDGSDESVTWSGRVKALEEQVVRLTKEKRRTERMLYLTRSMIRPGPLKTKAGRPKKSTTTAPKVGSGPPRRRGRPPKTALKMASAPSSTPTEGGGSES